MPPSDPRLCPVLERSLPDDAVPDGQDDGYRLDGTVWLVKFGDGGERPVVVISWRRDVRGRDVILAEWSAAEARWTERYVADRTRMRPA